MAGIRKGDTVEVLAGNDRGKRGKVLRVLPDKSRLVVQGVNVRWKHLRKSQQNPQGGRMQREMPIHTSNVMLYDEAAGQRTRVGFVREGGRKIRIARKTGKEVGSVAGGSERATRAKKSAKKKAAAKAKPEAGTSGGEE